MADADAPVDVIGAGSFIPDTWPGACPAADTVACDGVRA